MERTPATAPRPGCPSLRARYCTHHHTQTTLSKTSCCCSRLPAGTGACRGSRANPSLPAQLLLQDSAEFCASQTRGIIVPDCGLLAQLAIQGYPARLARTCRCCSLKRWRKSSPAAQDDRGSDRLATSGLAADAPGSIVGGWEGSGRALAICQNAAQGLCGYHPTCKPRHHRHCCK